MNIKKLLSSLLLVTAMTIAPHRLSAQTSYKAPQLNEKHMAALGLANHKFRKKADGVWQADNGTTIYSSHPHADDIKGFAGPTPLFIAVGKNGKIAAVAPAPNGETSDFWELVQKARLFNSWNGLTPAKAAAKKVDAVSGATFSSTAVINTVKATAKAIKK